MKKTKDTIAIVIAFVIKRICQIIIHSIIIPIIVIVITTKLNITNIIIIIQIMKTVEANIVIEI